MDHTGIQPDPEKIAAITHVCTSKNVGDVRRFLGMINQLSKFSPNLAEETQPLRELLSKERAWVWGEPQELAFCRLKKILTNAPVLAHFDPNRETIVSADASSYGLGAVLLQKQENGEFQLVAFISHSMTPTEQRYAQIEKEALAFTWACERLTDYLMGLTFHVQTDHKPLVPLFTTKHLEELPLRVQRFRLRMMRFNFSMSHVPGKHLLIADALSRSPNAEAEATNVLHEEIQVFVDAVLAAIPATEERIEQIRQAQQKNTECQKLLEAVQTGWPAKQTLPASLKLYHSVAGEITVANDLLLRGSRIIIPPQLQKEVLQRIHNGHLGITKCRERAKQSVWWPRISEELTELIAIKIRGKEHNLSHLASSRFFHGRK